MLKRMRRIGLFVLAIAVVISSAIIASANERSGTTTGSATAQTTASSYVIENKSSDKKDITVTIQHYNGSKKIYLDDVKTLSYGSKINDYAKAINWDVSSVTVDGNAVSNKNYIELTGTGSATVVVNYTAKETDVLGDTSFYDYTVRAGESNGNYYSFNMLGDNTNQRLTSGTSRNSWKGVYWNGWQNIEYQSRSDLGTGNNYETYSYELMKDDYDVNAYTGSSKVIKGLLNGIDSDGNVKFNYTEPGFFVKSNETVTINGKETYLRRYIDSMNLKFHKTGDTYKLTSVIDTAQNNKEVTTSGSNFFPLNDYSTEGTPNYFFGMRYDVEFAIGDYVGDLTYKFTGDDDMWVVLDNTNVIIDLGGIHAAATDSVDLWSKLGLTPGSLTEDQKNQTHKLTILYMERGAGESNCQMEFTLPNAKVVDVTEKPKADLRLQKVDENGNGLSDAVFKLENDSTKEASRVKSTSDGNITFSGLKEGTYTLTEVSAPDGYLVSDDTWKVRVTVDSNNNAVAKLYLVKDDQEQEVAQTNGKYKIENKKVQEIIENSLQYDKTAKVKDWDERTYDINITAKSLSTSSSVVQKEAVADIMMVLDISGSMLYNGNSNNPTDNGGFRTVGKYCDVKNSLDVNKVYYYSNTLTDVSYKHTNGNSYTYKNAKYPMILLNYICLFDYLFISS